MACEFCAAGILLRPTFRKRPVDQLGRDSQALRQLCPERFNEFADDNTFADHRWGEELCEALWPLLIR
ncbi:MAG: hypothetical protein RMI91_13445 [Gemmatales bacterium]|nr:hypothetical protein [Gemmatales bacterium]MDW7995650.1 hypothetical protein [Gemmatales bacterium]